MDATRIGVPCFGKMTEQAQSKLLGTGKVVCDGASDTADQRYRVGDSKGNPAESGL